MRESAKAQRIRRIRTAAWSAGTAFFLTAWLVLFVQLAHGHDPALSGKRAAAVQSAPDSPERRQAPATGAARQILIDPETGQAVDAQTGQPVDPQTGQPIDPQTGQPLDQQQQGGGVGGDPNAASPTPLRSRQS